MSQVPFLPAAEEEFLRAVAWYEAERPGLGAEFVAEVEHAVRRIISFPQHGSPYLVETLLDREIGLPAPPFFLRR